MVLRCQRGLTDGRDEGAARQGGGTLLRWSWYEKRKPEVCVAAEARELGKEPSDNNSKRAGACVCVCVKSIPRAFF